MTAGLAAVWPFVRRQLPSAPARVLEVGCGSLGGLVPALLEAGYDAIGVDPAAPEGPVYQQVEVERYDPPWPVDCVVASTSLHHVADLDEVLDRLAALLVPGGCCGRAVAQEHAASTAVTRSHPGLDET
jgi:trans-aconitate methyltransferase